MAFWGCEFVFDGIPSFEYGLMLYDIGVVSEDGALSPEGKIIEDRTNRSYSPLHYGVVRNTPLTFTMTFGADINSVEANKHLDRWELNAISKWLTGHKDYKYLEILQPDMEAFRYRCIITKLDYITHGQSPWAFTCTVVCDSPYSYMYPDVTHIDSVVSNSLVLESIASCEFYYPKLEITIRGGESFSIINSSDNNREFKFANVPTTPITIYVDNENEIITNSHDLNLYKNFNFSFFRLIRGLNSLSVIGDGTIDITCEFPVSIGG